MIYQNLQNSSRNRRGLGELKWPTSGYKPHLFPFSFPACQGGSPASRVGHLEAVGLVKAMAQRGPGTSGASAPTLGSCVAFGGKSPAAAAQVCWEALSLERGGRG